MSFDSGLIRQNVNDAWARIESLLKREGANNEFRAPASQEQLVELERKLEMMLPIAVRAHLLRHDGCVTYGDQIVVASPFMSSQEIFRDWQTNCEVDEDSAKEIDGSNFEGLWWHQRMVPVAGSDGDCVCVDSKTGKVYSHDHGMGGIGIGDSIAPSLEAWLAVLADRFEAGEAELEGGKAFLEMW